jgi:hypothetical protein
MAVAQRPRVRPSHRAVGARRPTSLPTRAPVLLGDAQAIQDR